MKFKKFFILSSFFLPLNLTSCAFNATTQNQTKSVNHQIQLKKPKQVKNQDLYNAVMKIYNQNQQDTRSSSEFLKARTININYPSQIVELYNDDTNVKFYSNVLSLESATAWILDKDLSQPNTYYLATNIHAIAKLLNPTIYTNLENLYNTNNEKYFKVDQAILDEINLAHEKALSKKGITNFKKFIANYQGEIPQKLFSTNNLTMLDFNNIQENESINSKTEFNFEKIQKISNYFQKNKVHNYTENNNLSLDNSSSQIEVFEIINPTFYDFNFKNYNQIYNNQIKTQLYSNVSSDFVVIKIKLKPGVEKTSVFQEYEKSPTLIDWFQPKIGHQQGELVSSFGFPFKKQNNPNNNDVILMEHFNNIEIIKALYEPEIKIHNNRATINQTYQDNFKINNSLSVPIWLNENNQLKKIIFNSINQKVDYYLKLPNTNLFREGASGSGIISSDKSLVGIFYSSNANEMIKEYEPNLILNVNPLLENNINFNVIEGSL